MVIEAATRTLSVLPLIAILTGASLRRVLPDGRNTDGYAAGCRAASMLAIVLMQADAASAPFTKKCS